MKASVIQLKKVYIEPIISIKVNINFVSATMKTSSSIKDLVLKPSNLKTAKIDRNKYTQARQQLAAIRKFSIWQIIKSPKQIIQQIWNFYTKNNLFQSFCFLLIFVPLCFFNLPIIIFLWIYDIGVFILSSLCQLALNLLFSESKKKRYILVGETGSGKSSLINILFEKEVPTGMGGCTRETIKIDVQSTTNQIYETPGLLPQSTFQRGKQELSYKFLDEYDKIFVLFEASLKSLKKLIVFTAGRKKEIILIRSKCDKFGQGQYHTLEEELDKDRRLLQSWGIQKITLFTTTARRYSQSFDNDKIKILLLS